jgi:glucokinase
VEECFIGVDWGGTRIKIGAVRADGSFLGTQTLSTDVTADVGANIARLAQELESLIKISGAKLLGLGLGLTGPVDPDRGVVLLPGKIKGLEGFPIVPLLRERFAVPVWAENDGGMAMYAEKYFGHARGKKWAVVLTIGTGVGSGVMLDGRILKDAHFMFGSQAGHLIIDGSHDQLCLTGARGTGETLCSATALALAVRGGIQRGIPSTLSERYWKDAQSVDFKAIIEDGVAVGDRLCLDELARWTRHLGWLLVSVIHAYSPEVVILAGGASAGSRFFLPQLQQQVKEQVFRYPSGEEVPILISQLGDHSGVLGASAFVREKMGLIRD